MAQVIPDRDSELPKDIADLQWSFFKKTTDAGVSVLPLEAVFHGFDVARESCYHIEPLGPLGLLSNRVEQILDLC